MPTKTQDQTRQHDPWPSNRNISRRTAICGVGLALFGGAVSVALGSSDGTSFGHGGTAQPDTSGTDWSLCDGTLPSYGDDALDINFGATGWANPGFTIPFQFWTNEAIAGYYRAKTGDDGTQFNKERIRNWKRLLNLKEASPFLVRGWDDANKRLKLEKRREILKRIDKVHGIPIPVLPDA